MPIISQKIENGTKNIHSTGSLQYDLPALFPGPIHTGYSKGSGSPNSRLEGELELRSFNKKLAFDIMRKLKSTTPDITAAFVLGTIHKWQKSRRYSYMGNRVPGAAYQSVEGIREDLPWLDRSTVLRAIERLEEAFPKDFLVSRESTMVLNFEISNNLTRQYFTQNSASKNKGAVHLSLHPSDAEKHGVVAALLIRNLEFKTRRDKVTNPLMDDKGRIYGEMNRNRWNRGNAGGKCRVGR
jgi:hypothetical protein